MVKHIRISAFKRRNFTGRIDITCISSIRRKQAHCGGSQKTQKEKESDQTACPPQTVESQSDHYFPVDHLRYGDPVHRYRTGLVSLTQYTRYPLNR